MNIREASKTDIASLMALNDEVHAIHVRLFPDVFKLTDPAALSEWFRSWLDDDKTTILVAEDADGLAAYLTLRKEERPAHLFVHCRKCAYIDQVCVTEQYRGKGVFRLLLNAARNVAREWGLPRLELDVWSENEQAKAAFVRCGFQTYIEKMKLTITE